MPYTKCVDRTKFEVPITQMLTLLKDPTDNLYIKGEYFGYFVNRLVKKFLIDPNYANNSFNSFTFNEAKKKTLTNVADSISVLINRSDPIASAGDLNYAISATLWGFLGEAEGFNEVGYGMRTFLRAIIEKVSDTTEVPSSGSQRDVAMAFRRHLVVRGVLGDVIDETNRRKTFVYEDKKLSQNGDLWKDGKLVLTDNALIEG